MKLVTLVSSSRVWNPGSCEGVLIVLFSKRPSLNSSGQTDEVSDPTTPAYHAVTEII